MFKIPTQKVLKAKPCLWYQFKKCLQNYPIAGFTIFLLTEGECAIRDILLSE